MILWAMTALMACRLAQPAHLSNTHLEKRGSFSLDMREELTLSIEQLRQRSMDSGWFMPVLLSDVEVLDIPLGARRTLRDLHFIR
jgi:hypothetical protein